MFSVFSSDDEAGVDNSIFQYRSTTTTRPTTTTHTEEDEEPETGGLHFYQSMLPFGTTATATATASSKKSYNKSKGTKKPTKKTKPKKKKAVTKVKTVTAPPVSYSSQQPSFDMMVDMEELVDPLSGKLQETESMDKEMHAMKEMFILMSEKKRKQKQERYEEYKNMYIEAYARDLAKVFRQAQKEAKVFSDELHQDITQTIQELQESEKHMMRSHEQNHQVLQAEIELLTRQIQETEELEQIMDQMYEAGMKDIEVNFEKLHAQVEHDFLQQFQLDMKTIAHDSTFLKVFQPQIERLMINDDHA